MRKYDANETERGFCWFAVFFKMATGQMLLRHCTTTDQMLMPHVETASYVPTVEMHFRPLDIEEITNVCENEREMHVILSALLNCSSRMAMLTTV